MSSPTVAKPTASDKPEPWSDPTGPARRCALVLLGMSVVQAAATLVAWWW